MSEQAPRHLSRASKRLWRDVLSRYRLDPEHLVVLRLGLEALDRAEQARGEIAEHGLTVPGARGALVANPAVAIERDARLAVLRSFRQLGLDQYGEQAEQARDSSGRFEVVS